ncbi:MAG: energy-coupling factor transporter ATPase [Ruminococcaceae bacterium]|nr:energy-coupling factor transporter ATPase [Oscillospiraceae bacterium]
MNKLEVKNVSFLYSKGTPFEKKALNNVSVGFEAGKITGLIGHTGSGKSTLVSLLNGLYKPHSGEILLDGVNIWAKPSEISKIRYKVGLVMQYPEYQLFDDTVRSDIAFGPRNQGLSDEEIEARVQSAARFTGLDPELLDKSPFDLSGGQKRRVAIAGILAMDPEVLVLDEPAAGLDPRGRREILGGLSAYVRECGKTLILVSHSMEDMAYYCDNVVVMSGAEVYKSGTVDEIFSSAGELEAIGLDVPVIARIAERLRAAGIPLEGSLYTVDGVRDAIKSLLGGDGK